MGLEQIWEGGLKQLSSDVIGNTLWLLLPILFLMFFRSAGEQVIQGILWKCGRTYNTHDLIVFDDKLGRIGHIGFWSTEFIIYQIAADKVAGGYVMRIANDELKKHRIMKPLGLHDIPESLRTIHKK